MRILITGGAGFIGTRLARRLLVAGYEVAILDSLIPQVHGDAASSASDIASQVPFFPGPLSDKALLANALTDVDAVVHLAAETGPAQSMYCIQRYFEQNVQATAALLEALMSRRDRIRRLVVASSRAIYGEGQYYCQTCEKTVYPEPRSPARLQAGLWELLCPICHQELIPQPTEEAAPPRPTSQYAITKWTQEQMCLLFGRGFGIPTVALRYQNVYGAGQSLTNPYIGILAIFAARIKAGEPINLYEDGRESRDFLHVEDAVEATYLALHQPNLWDCVALNVGSGQRTSLGAVAETLSRIMGGTERIEVTGQYRVGDIRHNYADLRQIRNWLGFSPKITLERGLTELVAWSWNAPSSSLLDQATQELVDAGLFSQGRTLANG